MPSTLSFTSEQDLHTLHLKSVIQELPLYETWIELDCKISEIDNIFKENPLLPGIIVMNRGELVGIVSQRRFLEYVSRSSKIELFLKPYLHQFNSIVCNEVLLLSSYTSISAAVRQCLRRSRELFDEPIVVNVAPGIYKLLDVQQLLLAHSQVHEKAVVALQESEDRFQYINENSPVMMYSLDEKGNICNANSRWLEETGYSRSEVKGQPADFLIYDKSQVQILKILPQVWRDGCVRDIPAQYVKRDGTAIDVLLDCHATTNAEGKRIAIAIVRNVTRRQEIEKALQEAKEQLRAVLDAVPGFVAWIGSDLRYLGVNRYSADAFNLSPEAFVGQELGFLNVSPKFTDFMSQSFENPAETISQEMTEEVDGTFRSYLLVAQKYNQGQAAVIVGIDITTLKRLEKELRQALEREKELGELKSRFVSMTSHEFRTPLSTILSSADLLERYSHKWTQEKKVFHFNRVQTAVKHMIQLLDDVLFIGKAEAGRLEFNPTRLDVEQFCLKLVEELQVNEDDKQAIAFSTQGKNNYSLLDEKILHHVLSNLLSNGIKYSPKDTTVRFELIFQDAAVVFKVQDRGIGIPAEDQRHLFEPFHRATNVGNLPGTGLGLAIVKKCVDLHGGQMFVDSQVGVGTTFTVKLPASERNLLADAQPKNHKPTSSIHHLTNGQSSKEKVTMPGLAAS